MELWILRTVKQWNPWHWKHHLKFTSSVVTWHILVSHIDHLWQIDDTSNNRWVYFINKSSFFFGKCHNPVTFLMSHMVPLHAGLFMHIYKWNNFWQWCWVNSVFWSFNFSPVNDNTLLWSDCEFKLCQYTSLISVVSWTSCLLDIPRLWAHHSNEISSNLPLLSWFPLPCRASSVRLGC